MGEPPSRHKTGCIFNPFICGGLVRPDLFFDEPQRLGQNRLH